jgi:pimeloyl-ACP methyl ester carboxylesterase
MVLQTFLRQWLPSAAATQCGRLLPLLVAATLLSACGHGNNSTASQPPPQMSSAPQRGQLVNNPPPKVAHYSPSDLLSMLTGNDLGQELQRLPFSPKCSIDIYHMEYATVGGQNEATTASGALMVPTGSDASCQGPRPVLVYAHGTATDKTFNIADLTKQNNGEGLILASVFAAQGYIVVAPNYAGYDTSTLAYHPYVNADQQSKDTMDALTAARSAFAMAGASDNQKLFLTGYSQGGFVAMATHRALQASGTAVTASAPMSGPYALAAFGDAIFMGEVNLSATPNFNMVTTSYQHSYGNVYSNPMEVFEAKYANGMDELLPTASDISTLYSEGRLPQSALFNSTPPAPQYASMTPATQPANLAPAFAMGFGPDNLVTNQYRLAYLQDAQANPDGGFPNTTTGAPATNPGNALRQDLKQNDLRNWVPTAPVLLCAGNSDPTVFYLNTQLIQGYWAKNAPSSSVTVLDIDSGVLSGDPYADAKIAFAAAKAALQATGGTSAVMHSYHAGLVPPFCLVSVKAFFDAH